MTIIEMKNVRLMSGNKYILDIEKIEFKSPNVYGILGPNGSGKSTLLKTICGIERKYKGSIEIDQKNVILYHNYVSSVTGSIIENPSLYVYSTPEEFIGYVSEMRRGKKIDKSEEIEMLIGMLNLREKKDQIMKNFSTGEIKRVGIAAAIAGDPKCIILDEPTDNLDVIGKDLIVNIVKNLREQNKLVIIASHDVDFLNKVCDQVIFLREGRVVETVNVNDAKTLLIKLKDLRDLEKISLTGILTKDGNTLTFNGDVNNLLVEITKMNIEIENIDFKNKLDEKYREIFSDEI